MLEDHSPVGGLADALRRQQHGAARRRVRRRGLARLRDSAGSPPPSRARRPLACGPDVGAARRRRPSRPMSAEGRLARPPRSALDQALRRHRDRRRASVPASTAGSPPCSSRTERPGRPRARGSDHRRRGRSLRTTVPSPERLHRAVDRRLDRWLGYYPLAIRLNHRHGFHRERMAPGHDNWMLDSSRVGPLPRWEPLERRMASWHFGRTRYVPDVLRERMRAECGALALSNVQPRAVVPFLVAGAPPAPSDRRARRELGPHGRQGRHRAFLRRLRRPERARCRTT